MSTTATNLDKTGTTTSTSTTNTVPSNSVTRGRGALSAEWVKFRSLRSNFAILVGAASVMIITGVIFSGFVGGVFEDPGEASEFINNPVGATLRGTILAPLIIGVLGIMTITGEYATGTIRTSLTMVPKRLPVLWAKTAVVAAVAFASMLTSTFIVFFAGQAIMATGDVATASLGDAGVLRALIGTAGYLTGIAIIGLGIGTLLRSSAAAISTLVAAIFILPGLGGLLLPAGWRDDVLKYLPSNAGEAIMQVNPAAGILTPTGGILVFLGWIAVTLAAATATLMRRPS